MCFCVCVCVKGQAGSLICPLGIPHLCSRYFLVASHTHTHTCTRTRRQSFYFCEKIFENECLNRPLDVASVNRLIVNLTDEAAAYFLIKTHNRGFIQKMLYIPPKNHIV